jgi:thiamine biosynthesis protein ThiS
MEVIINGEPQQLAEPLTVATLLEARGMAGKRVAVERNGEIVPKSRHAETRRWPRVTRSKSSSPSAAAEPGNQHARRSARHRRQEPTARACWSAPASTRTSRRRAKPSIASGAEIITVAIRRTNIGQEPGQPSLLEVAAAPQFTILPNTAGCYTADDAVRTCASRANCLMATPCASLKCWAIRKPCSPTCRKPSRPQSNPGQGWLPGHGVLRRRSDPGAHAGRHRLRRQSCRWHR